MGVQGLWELLQPVGRTVDLQTMANRRYAVDASIWITQFFKAMRDEEGAAAVQRLVLTAALVGMSVALSATCSVCCLGNMMKNAHILGFFRCVAPDPVSPHPCC